MNESKKQTGLRTASEPASVVVPIGSRVIDLIEIAYRARRPVLLDGPTGIGKSQIVAEFARGAGLEMTVLDLSLLEPPDLVGLPVIEGGRTRYASPAELPSSGRGVLMLEELNRAEIPVMQPALQLLSARRLHSYELPPDWLCVAAVNPEGADYQVNPLDPALRSRLHEIQHVVLGHLTSPRLHAVLYPKVMEIAMEISADETIPIPLPDHGFSMKRFMRYGIRPGQSSLERYQLLAAAYECGDLRMEEFWQARPRDDHRPRQGSGTPCAGVGDLLDARSDRGTGRRWQQERWGRGAPASAGSLERMKLEIARHLRGERGGHDDPLASTQRRIAKELERVVFDSGGGPLLAWRRILREAFPKKRHVRPDYLRPNRRFPARVGEIPGRTRRVPRPALLVGIDTSGSMTGVTLDRVACELRRLAAFARLTVLECDTVVHRIYPFVGTLGPFVGGGDTDFGPLFHEAGLRTDAEGLVLFTDGKGQMPESAPAIPTLWVLTHNDPFLANWGSITRMP